MIIRNLILVLALLQLTACGGGLSNFVRPADNQIKLGETDRAQIVAMLQREPDATGQTTINGIVVDQIEYAYVILEPESTDAPNVEGNVAVKTQLYYLNQGKLVGSEYYSTFAADSTRFNADNLSHIVKGKTTKQEAVELLGTPTVKFIRPLVSDMAVEAIGYNYRTMIIAGIGNLKSTGRRLILELDSNGTVIDIDYESKNSKT